MFAKAFLSVATLLAVAAPGAVATPVPSTSLAARTFDGYSGFNHFGGSLSNFDDFFGADNFCGFHNTQVLVEEKTVVCHTEEIEIIQQRLVVLQEFAKRIITEQICEVETQTVVWEQFISGFETFSGDLRRVHGSDRHIGFDDSVASHFGSLVNEDGSLTTNDLGFKGSDVGSHLVGVGGSNWNDAISPFTVGSAFNAAQGASFDSSI